MYGWQSGSGGWVGDEGEGDKYPEIFLFMTSDLLLVPSLPFY